ncbi:MAG: hypothetical protein ACK4QW_16925 [Alphaproteobacteria bacterium]
MPGRLRLALVLSSILSSLAVAACAGGARTPAPNFVHDDPQGPESNYFLRAHQGAVGILPRDGQGTMVRSVHIHTAGETLVADARAGVETENQNRIRLTGTPIVGGLFGHRYSADDLTRRNRVGTVLLDGERLFVTVDGGRFLPVTEVVVLNQNNATRFRAAPRSVRSAEALSGRPVGSAFVVEDTTLLVLVEPSVIQHNIFERL